jgi:hypothetical protein
MGGRVSAFPQTREPGVNPSGRRVRESGKQGSQNGLAFRREKALILPASHGIEQKVY